MRNRQSARHVSTPLLRRIVRSLLNDLAGVGSYELCLHLVAEQEMARLNETFLRHAGTTDVITFDYSAGQASSPARSAAFPPVTTKRTGKTPVVPEGQDAGPAWQGEIFVCVDEAVAQARRFGTSWQSELVRYVVHGVLHLRGFDDQRRAARRKMKREENCMLRELAKRFPLTKLARARRAGAARKS